MRYKKSSWMPSCLQFSNMKVAKWILLVSLAFCGQAKADFNHYFYTELTKRIPKGHWQAQKVDLAMERKSKPPCAFRSNETSVVYRAGLDLELIESSYAAPTSFDARTHWPHCKSIKKIWNQSSCGSCWAFSSATSMSDRMCIHKGRQVLVSVEDILSCCGSFCGYGCGGGWPDKAFKYWASSGVCSGAGFGERGTCKPYSISPYQGHARTPACYRSCTDTSYPTPYDQDKSRGGASYRVPQNVQAIQEEIQTNGPVSAIINIYDDFYAYRGGVYRHTYGTFRGGHAVRIIGWGYGDGYPYWLIANSWGRGWGEKGTFRILRGTNEAGIESHIDAGLPA